MAAEGGKMVIPGDTVVHSASLAPGAVVRAGTGLAEVGSGLVAMRSGTVRVLSAKANDRAGDTHVWLDSNARRYTPCVQVRAETLRMRASQRTHLLLHPCACACATLRVAAHV